MKRLLGLILLAGSARAQQPYDVSLIPDSLKKGAHVVVRDDEESFVLASPTRATYKSHVAYTILDEQGQDALEWGTYTNTFVKLEDADIYVYDPGGNQIQHIKQKQMVTEGYGEELIDDGAITGYRVTAPSYPITVQVDYTLNFKGSEIIVPFSLEHTQRSFQQAQYTLVTPKSMTPRYKNRHLDLQPVIADVDKDNRSYTWKSGPIKAVPEEPGAPSDYVPEVQMAPTQFEMAGFPGDMSSWQHFGQWIYDLNKASFVLPDASRQFYQQMVSGAASDLDKARIIYDYLQKNFRYVSIQLGIGGQRSFPANFTEKKKYGDCKALSTYMRACLDAVGVKSYTALINAGPYQQPIDPSFPCDEFNHVILCIPQPKDSVWLECTSKYIDFGVLGDFTENRNALLITENGGVLAHTPVSTLEENTSIYNTKVALSDDGSGKAMVTFYQRGDDKEEIIRKFYAETRDNQKKFLVDDMDFPQPDDFTITPGQKDSAALKTLMSLTFEKVPEFTAGSKMFLNPRLYHIWPYKLPPSEHRTQDYYFANPDVTVDTTCYQLPEGYVVDQLPKGDSFSNDYASYTSSYWYDAAQKCVYSRGVLTLNARRIPARDYPLVKEFFGHVVKEETEKIVINKP
jgi:hypothetical protein